MLQQRRPDVGLRIHFSNNNLDNACACMQDCPSMKPTRIATCTKTDEKQQESFQS